MFFCLDVTGSMGIGGDHRPGDSVQRLLEDFTGQGVIFKVGGVKFNDPRDISPSIDSIDPDQLSSLTDYTTLNDFVANWIDNGYSPSGGDPQELQLDALHLAVTDMNSYSVPGNPNRYIVLVTDAPFHENEGGSVVTEDQVKSELAASGCKTYLSLWDDGYWSAPLVQLYQGLTINGDYDPVDRQAYTAALYPLNKVRARIMELWPSD